MIATLVLVTVVLSLRISAQDTQQEISIAVLQEFEQDDVPVMVAAAIKDIEAVYRGGIRLRDSYIQMDRDNLNVTQSQLCQAMVTGVTAVLDVTWHQWSEGKDLINDAGIGYFRLDVSVRPFVSALTKYLRARDATDAILIFQNENELTAGLYQLLDDSQLRVIVFNGINTETADQIRRIRPVPSYCAILAAGNNMLDIVQEVKRQNLLQRADTWSLVFLDFNNEHFFATKFAQGANLIVPNESMCCRLQSKMADCSCSDAVSVPKSALTAFLGILVTTVISEGVPNVVAACDGNSNATQSMEFYQAVVQRVNQSPVLVWTDPQTISFAINFTVYGEEEAVPGSTIELATIDDNEFKMSDTVEPIKQARRFFRIGVTEAIPWTYVERDPMTGESVLDPEGRPLWQGYCIDFIEKLSKVLNFDFELVPPRHGTFGSRMPDNSWNGLVGDLMIGETDIAVAALKMTAEREEVIDFIAPYFEQTGILIAIRNPVRQTSLFKFMTVLRLEVWLSIVAALIATAIMIWLLDKYSPYSARNNKEAYPYPCREFSLKESFWFALTSFTPQGGGEAPKALSGRTMVAAYWLFVVLMLATFTANLAAFLTVERMQTPVQSLDQLARQSRINYTVVANSDTHEYFINMKFAEDTLYRVWKEITLNSTNDQAQYRVWDYPIREQYGHILLAINSSNPVATADEGFRQVNAHENADYAFIHDSAEIKYEISRNCNLTVVGEVFAEQPYAIGVQQGSNLQDELSRTILELQKERFFEGLTNKYWNHSAKGQCENTDDSEGITLESLGGVFIATLFGLALAMVTLVGEVIYYKRKDRRQTSDVVRLVRTVSEAGSTAPPITVPPPPAYSEHANQITFGTEFVSAAQKRPKRKYTSNFPRHESEPTAEFGLE